MPAADAAALLRANAADPERRGRPAIRDGERVWTHAELFAESCRWANMLLARRPPTGRPFHVGVLMENTPEYLFAFGGAALAGATIVGANHTRRGEHLRADLVHTDCALVIAEPALDEALSPDFGATGIETLMAGSTLEAALEAAPGTDPGIEPGPDTRWALIFTSGTSGAPKAVICTQRRLLTTGSRMAIMLELTRNDVGYVCMPLFHSNAVMVGWAPSLVAGASVGLARRFSASRWLADVRHYGVTWWNYTGKPLAYLLATPERPDDANNTLRVAYGNEGSPHVVAEFSRRFGVHVIDAFGATEGGVALTRMDDMPAGAMGHIGDAVKVVAEDGTELPRARFDDGGRLVNAADCVGEIVNVSGVGPFEGYYNNDEANARATRLGWYWSGDLGYADEAGFLYFAGRSADWLRVDGENFPAGPIEAALSRHPGVLSCAVYGVPDADAGDQAMATLVMRDGHAFDPAGFAGWLDVQADIGPKWRPRYVRVTTAMPMSPTNKVLTRVLVHQKYRADRTGGDPIWVRERRDDVYRPFTPADEAALHAALEAAGRERFWDL